MGPYTGYRGTLVSRQSEVELEAALSPPLDEDEDLVSLDVPESELAESAEESLSLLAPAFDFLA